MAEGDGTPSVTVTAEVDGAARSTQTNVAVRATGGTAKAGVDFVDIGTVTVSIPAGATRATQSFGFSPIDDDIDEGASETVILSATAQGLTGSTATLTITDDDGRGINVSQGAVTVEEDDPSGGTYTVALVSQPAGTVTVRVAVSGNNEVKATPQTLIFTATDWNAPQTVTVTAEHDDDSQADSAQIRHTASGADYTGVSAVSVAVTVNDDDIRGVTISHTALKVREGGQGSYTVVLDTRPTGTVTVTPTVSGDDDVRVSPSTLRFSASRWNTPLTVTVTGAQDIDQAPDIATIAHTVAGADYGTEAVQANNIEVTITDDDVPSTGITISLSTDRVQESGGPIQITVTGELDASPALNDTTVTLTLGTGTAGDDDFVSIEPVPLTIRTGQTSGSAHVLVTPVADYIDEGTGETLRLRATTTSTLELRPQTTFEITIEDDDDPASNEITLTVSRQTLGESAGETQITVTGELNAAPAQSDIIATLTLEAGSADNDDFEAIEPVRLTIRAGRTSGSARVPVTPVNDRIDEGTGETLRLVAEVSQAPASLVIRQPNVFELTIEDDDEAALVLSRNALTVREGESATYTVRLDSQPTDSVTMTLSATGADAEEVTARPQELMFTAQDWNTPRTVTVSATKDTDGSDDSAEIGHALDGGGYDDISGEVVVTVDDIDTASRSVQIAIKPDRVEEDDATTTVEITATLNGATRSVATSVDLNANGGTATNGTDFTAITTVMVRIPAGELSATQTFHFTPIDDSIDEGLSETVIFNATTDGLSVRPATMTIVDNDGRGIELTSTLVEVEEGDANGETYTVALATQPTGTVTVRIAVSGNSDIAVTPTSLTFTDSSWSTPQPITITAAQDDDATHESAELRHTASGADYGGVRALALNVEVEDDDIQGVTISKDEVVFEEGGSATYTVVLDTQPTGTVTVRPEIITGGDEDVRTSPASLSFTRSSWSTAKTVTVSGAQDLDQSDDRTRIEHTVSGADYGETEVASVEVTVTDDDTASTQVRLTISTNTVHESDPRTQITVTGEVDGSPTHNPIEIELKFQDIGQAQAGRDYEVVQPVTLIIATGRTSGTQQIAMTPVNDRIDEGDGEKVRLVATTTSELELAPARSFDITIEDDDEAGLVLSHTALTVQEEGNTSYTVKLSSQPVRTVGVVVEVTGANADNLTITPDYLVFTGTSWNTAQTVTVEAGEDPDGDDGRATIEHWPDPSYAKQDVDLEVTMDDTDLTSSNVELSLTPAQITEDSTTQSVVLEAALDGAARAGATAVAVRVTGGTATPTADFVDIGTVTVTIPAGQKSATQTFDFSPVNDSIDEGLGESAVFGGTTPGLTVGTATLTITDDDGKGIVLSQSTVNVTEGADASYTVALATQPTGPVTVRVSVTGNSDVTVTPNSVEFTASNWNTPKTVTVNAAHDGNAADDTAELRHAASGGGYAGVTALALTVDVIDDDTHGVTISTTTLDVGEGDQATYTVVLDTEPTGTVTIQATLAPGSDEDVHVSPQTLNFTRSSWNSAKTVTVSAREDSDFTVDKATIEHSVSGADYGDESVTAPSVDVTVSDNDTASTQITLSLSRQAVRESDGATPITVTADLDAAPSDEAIEVTLDLEGSPGSAQKDTDFEGITPVTLAIAAGRTSASADVVLTPINDQIDEDSGETLRLVAQTNSSLELTPGSEFEITIEDDDERALMLSKTWVTVGEGESTTYTVKLATQPTATVTVTLSPSGAGASSLSTNPQTLTFTASSWNTAETVTVSAANDADANDETGKIVHAASGADYAGLRGELGVTILDKTGGPIVTGVTISPTPPGASAVYASPRTKDGLAALPANAVHGPGARLTFTVTFSRAVNIVPDANTGAAPELKIDIFGRPHTARYSGGSGTTQLRFGWTVSRGDYDANGLETRAFTENGAKIEDGTGREANTSGATQSNLQAHRIRGGFYNMRISAESTSVREGDELEIRVTRDEGHNVDAHAIVRVTDSGLPEESKFSLLSFPFYASGGNADPAVSRNRITVPGNSAINDDRTLAIEIIHSDFRNQWYEIGPPASVNVAVTENHLGADAPVLSVGPANAHEVPGATLNFEVSLNKTPDGTVTVDYTTRDGTATVADGDYVARSGTLTFEGTETEHTVAVEVLPDAHDEGRETVWLVLSNPQGAVIGRGENYGLIHNDGPIPKAWNARFGRTVAEQVLEAVEGRMRATPAPGAEVALAGERIGAQSPDRGPGQAEPGSDAEREARREEEARRDTQRLADWLKGETDPEEAQRLRSRAVTPRDLLTGSSFALTAETAGEDLVSLWGRGAVTRFDGREGDLMLDGEVVTGMLGADWTGGRWTAGLIVSHSTAEGGYSGAPDAGDAGSGGNKVEATLTGLFPWARHALSERLEAWGAAGYGAGDLTVTPKAPGTGGDGPAIHADLDLRMAAVGLRGTILDGGADGLTLIGKTDAMAVQTASGRGRGTDGGNLEPARATVTRLRLGVEASRPVGLGGGAVLTPGLEIGVRHDGGDAETGFGLDLGGGLALSDPKRGLQAELRGRGLLAHESKGFRDLGFSGSLAWEGKPGSDRGAKLRLTQTVGGSSAGGADALLSRTTMEGLAANDNGEGGDDELKSRRLELKFGYGLSAFGDRFTWTPEAGIGLSDTGRDYSLGWRLVRRGSGSDGGALELSLEARRRESANDDMPPVHEVGLRLTARF